MIKDIESYIKKFNVSQNKELDSLEKFPLEIFLPITENEIPDIKDGYYISNYSRVYSLISKKILKMKVNKHTGYYVFTCACKTTRQRDVTLHRILMMVFNPLDDYKGKVVNHLDGNKLNSFLYNLEWTDIKGNSIHARDSGLLHPAHSESHCCATITTQQAEQICKYLESRMYMQKDIAKLVGTTVGIVESIKQGRAWKEISSKYNLDFKTEKISKVFSFDDIHNICKYFQNNSKDDNESLRQHCIHCLEYLSLPVTASNINSLRKIYKKERWKFICNNYNY